jgi:tRNA dimethylallyltransferase
MATQILCIAGPTASGKSARAVAEALTRDGEVISVDSRQVYRRLDIGTEKITSDEMHGVPHHLIDIREVTEPYSAADFAEDATRLITEISERGKLPILVGGTSFYFDALLRPLSETRPDPLLRAQLENRSTGELYAELLEKDTRRAREIDQLNRRRLIRALEIIETHGHVPLREKASDAYDTEWIIIDSSREELRSRIDSRLEKAFARGLVEEVRWVAEVISVEGLNELGLEYRIVGEYLRGERIEESMFPALSAKLWQYARRQKAWLRKLTAEYSITAAQ